MERQDVVQARERSSEATAGLLAVLAGVPGVLLAFAIERSAWAIPVGLGVGMAAFLAAIDARTSLVPNSAVAAAATALVCAVTVGCVLGGSGSPAVRALGGGLLFAGPLFVAAAGTRARGVGGGDVKLAALLGATLGLIDLVVVLATLVLAALSWIAFGLRRRAGGGTGIFGPALVAVALLALVAAVMLSARGVELDFG